MSREDDGLAYGEFHDHQKKKDQPGTSLFGTITSGIRNISGEIKRTFEGQEDTTINRAAAGLTQHRYGSFASPKHGNDVKWYVDGCGYFYAVSRALEAATDSIWILDWWLSPELYLRRPPAENEKYRLDRMLQAAAQRGVKVSVIVYKEVTQAMTRKYLSPTLPDYLHSLLPRSTDTITSSLVRLGLEAITASLEYVEETSPLIDPPVTVSSSHTKHALEALHPNITVYRHPDHLPDERTMTSSISSTLHNLKLSASSMAKMPGDTIKAIYGLTDDVVLYWAHHEKLLLIDGHTAFMGGLDLCFGRWDTNQHSIADAHPSNLDAIIFPGQDYNNARIADFSDVAHWDQNKVSRKESSRMGWSDVSISLHGPCIQDLRRHFIHRWNFIFEEKYNVPTDKRNYKLDLLDGEAYGTEPPSQSADPPSTLGNLRDRVHSLGQKIQTNALDLTARHIHRFKNQPGQISAQLVRSCTTWSNGTATEHSVQNAYIEIIQNSQHVIYMENQFFVTATGKDQNPVENQVGKAIVERILRAARSGEKFKVIVLIPSIPGFAGALGDDSALGTRAIMELQYQSINRGKGKSIMELIEKEGFDPTKYIRFYNLRNYDRINASGAMRQAEEKSGVDYEEARMQHDNVFGAGYGGKGEQVDSGKDRYKLYEQALGSVDKKREKWDSVASCYMLGGEDIRNVPWEDNGDISEIDAFVSEELYIHSKVLVADDQIVICGSANMNDRSQLGTHDSEIALIIEDPTPLDSKMDGKPWQASRFAASLRRQLCRKHLGLLKPQDPTKPDVNFEPVGVANEYDWGSVEDRLVEDPLSDEFQSLWNQRARTNTEIFRQIFHPVPDDTVRTWKDYSTFYEYYFHDADDEAQGKDEDKKPARYKWGHVIRENFEPGEAGLKQVKDLLSQVKGTLVEMPLNFLDKEDIAKMGMSLNPLTISVYT